MCCAGYGNGTDTCQGDSGGPLVVEEADGDLFNLPDKGSFIIGITSWGIYILFIKRNIKQHKKFMIFIYIC